MAKHLTDAQISDVLLGEDLDARSRAHLAGCECCTREISSTRSALLGFHELGTSWAESEAIRAVPVPSRKVLGFKARAGWAWVLTAVATCALVIAFVPQMHTPHTSKSQPVQEGPSAMLLQRDNQWLQAMDRDLREGPDNISVSTAALTPSPTHTRRHTPRVIED